MLNRKRGKYDVGNYVASVSLSDTFAKILYLFIYLGFYVAFNTVQVIS